MTVNNLAIESFPESFDGIYGHDLIIQTLKDWIKTDTLPPGIMFSGNPGVGKGCLTHNLIKTTLCQNRKPTESTRCNQCDICTKMDPTTTNPRNNVMWIQVGSTNSSTINSQIKDAIEYSQIPPTGNRLADRGSKYHKFIVIDEIQGIQQTLLEQLFLALENKGSIERNRVTFILITMNEPKLENKDSIALKALKDRIGNGYFKLHPPSNLRLHQYALDLLHVEDDQIRELLVESAENSYRGLLSSYDKLLTLSDFNNLDLVESKLQLAAASSRAKFWELFSHGSSELRDYWSLLAEKYGEVALVKQLFNDLANQTLGSKYPIGFYKSMREFLRDPSLKAFPLIFAPYAGTFTVIIDVPNQPKTTVANVSAI